MALSCARLEAKIRHSLPAEYVDVTDVSDGSGSKFNMLIVSNAFEGLPLLERQRAVNECLREEMAHIHAVQMKTWTVAQYETKMQQRLPDAATLTTSESSREC